MSQYPLLLPDDVLDEARTAAEEQGSSVDELLSSIIVEGLEHRRGALMMQARASRADPAAALALVKSLPSAPTEPWDELPKRIDTDGMSR